jgi:HAD superfamily hydrolase (TIGR01509 family)
LEPVRGLHRLTDWVREKGLRRAAVTNAPRPNAEQMIDTLGLKDFFDHVVVGSECERAKPFPDPYLKALEKVGVSPENAFAIEDSPSGLKAAVSAGLPVVGITTGNPGSALLDAGASFLIKDYNDPALWEQLKE